MRTLFTMVLILVATTASAQLPDSMGMFFSDTEFSWDTTNLDTDGDPFDAYVVIANPSPTFIAGYEVGIEITDPDVMLVCTYTSDPHFDGVVATLNGHGIGGSVAVEGRSFSDVKGLFR